MEDRELSMVHSRDHTSELQRRRVEVRRDVHPLLLRSLHGRSLIISLLLGVMRIPLSQADWEGDLPLLYSIQAIHMTRDLPTDSVGHPASTAPTRRFCL